MTEWGPVGRSHTHRRGKGPKFEIRVLGLPGPPVDLLMLFLVAGLWRFDVSSQPSAQLKLYHAPVCGVKSAIGRAVQK